MGTLRAAAIFSDNMVLQRDKPVRVWGHAYSGRTVTVEIDDRKAAAVCRHNEWSVTLPPMSVCFKTYTMTITDGEETVIFNNVAVGEVWIAGGQSNMEFELRNDADGAEALAEAKNYDIRYYYTKKNAYIDEFFYIDERNGGWTAANGESEKYWSAVGYYFAKKLNTDLKIPIGIIGCNWGGTSASAWTDEELLRNDSILHCYTDDYDNAMAGKSFEEYCAELDEYNAYVAQWEPKISEFYAAHPDGSWEDAQKYAGEARYPEPLGPKSPFRAGGLYRTMLCRIAPYTVRGVIFYQGESDDHRPDMYERLLRLMTDNWRQLWKDDGLYFLIVQLPMHKWGADENGTNWAVIREAQRRVCETTARTYPVCILDCGEYNNIHPVHKAKVGLRLGLCALGGVYGEIGRDEALAPSADYIYPDGSDIIVILKDEQEVHAECEAVGFEIAGDDNVFYPAKAEIHSDCIILSSDKVPSPVHARYQYINWGEVNIFNRHGQPLMPFVL